MEFLNNFRKVIQNDEWQMVMVSYPYTPKKWHKYYQVSCFQMHLLAIVGRILILDSMAFIEVLQELNIPSPLETILDIWIQKMPLIGQPDKRKLLSK